MANYCAFTKIMMDDSVNRTNSIKSKSPFHSSSWIFQSKDAKKEIPQEDTKKSFDLIKPINDYEIRCVYKINMKGYYKNVPIYRENRNKYIPNYDKVLQNKKK
jgi:hypothetical protein